MRLPALVFFALLAVGVYSIFSDKEVDPDTQIQNELNAGATAPVEILVESTPVEVVVLKPKPVTKPDDGLVSPKSTLYRVTVESVESHIVDGKPYWFSSLKRKDGTMINAKFPKPVEKFAEVCVTLTAREGADEVWPCSADAK